jgi:hypothetical protein
MQPGRSASARKYSRLLHFPNTAYYCYSTNPREALSSRKVLSMPKLHLSVTISLSYLLISVLCGLYYCSLSPSPDQSLFDYIAWQGLHNVQWYVGSFDFTWPGSLVIHEIGIRLFGVHRWTARLTDFLLLQPAILAMFLFLRTAGLHAAAIGIGLTYPLIYVTSGPWMAGHRDIVAMHVLIGSAAILLSYRGDKRLTFFLAGLVVGYAVMIRPTYVTFAPVLLIAGLWGSRLPTAKHAFTITIALGIGLLIFPATFLIAGFMTGTFDAWLADTRFVFDVYQVPLSRTRLFFRFFEILGLYFAWLSAIGAASAIFWLTNDHTRRHAILLCGMVLVAIVSFAAQNKGFGYHLGGLIPIFTISALGGINLAFTSAHHERKPIQNTSRALAVAFALVLCVGLERRAQNNLLPYMRSVAVSSQLTPGDRAEEIAKQAISIVARESNVHAYFFQWGWNFDIGFRSERLAASRYLNTQAFSLIAKDDVAYHSWLETFDRDLAENKPAFILLDLTTIPKETKIDEYYIHLPADAIGTGLAILVSHLNQTYAVRFRWEDKILFKRIGA